MDSPPDNKALSQRRADVAASMLSNVKPKEIVGQGEKQLLYDNDFPEGRYYSRTVTVIIETPAENQARLGGADTGVEATQ